MRKSSDRKTLLWISRIAAREKFRVPALCAVRIGQGVCGVLYAYCLKIVVDQAAAGGSGSFTRALVLFAALIVLSLVLGALGRHLQEKARCTLEQALRSHAFDRLLHRDYTAVTGIHSGEWMNRITADSQVIANAASSLLPDVSGTVVRLLSALAALLLLLPKAALILLPCGVIMMLLSWALRGKLKQLHASARQADGAARSFMQERLMGLLVLRTFGRENDAASEAASLTEALTRARMRRAVFSNLSGTAVSAALMGAQFIGVALCGWGILSGSMSYGSMSAVLYLVNMLETPFARLSGYLSQYYAMLASAERLMEIDALPEDPGAHAMDTDDAIDYYGEHLNAIALQNVSFHYVNGEPVLKNCSFTVDKGQFVAFTGPSGVGKSTAMKLLLSLYEPTEGRILTVNSDGAQKPLTAAHRSLFAYVPQGNLLLSGTVRQAVTFAAGADITEEDIRKALSVACAEEFVSALPQGLDTPLGEGGSGLSEGQQQRLSIARAILSARPILLLDEATSALDAATEKQLLQNLRALQNRTVIIITHRSAVLEVCDREIAFAAPDEQEEPNEKTC